MRAVHKPPPEIRPPRPLGEGLGVRVMTMPKIQINASDPRSGQRSGLTDLDGPWRELLHKRFLPNQSNASSRRTTRTQTPDPVLPVPTMPNYQNTNPLTIFSASHTGSEVRGEGNNAPPARKRWISRRRFRRGRPMCRPCNTLMRHPSAARRLFPTPFLSFRPPFLSFPRRREPSHSGRASAANYYLGTPSRVRLPDVGWVFKFMLKSSSRKQTSIYAVAPLSTPKIPPLPLGEGIGVRVMPVRSTSNKPVKLRWNFTKRHQPLKLMKRHTSMRIWIEPTKNGSSHRRMPSVPQILAPAATCDRNSKKRTHFTLTLC